MLGGMTIRLRMMNTISGDWRHVQTRVDVKNIMIITGHIDIYIITEDEYVQ